LVAQSSLHEALVQAFMQAENAPHRSGTFWHWTACSLQRAKASIAARFARRDLRDHRLSTE
jgi:hypothetical protein